ncbi:MAG TPA: dihydroorotate dehydrogenase-like protein [Candidatus Polarisedimenticolaceae bacterium]|nr:dihydroorotate dehydrogenase-like protein [Candidatus Polarisedimenticolaceae bacterium]
MDLRTRYLGLDLAHPLMPGASPLVDDMDNVRRLEDAGASCIVMHSLFEEQLVQEELAALHYVEPHEDSFAEALSYVPTTQRFQLGPDEYLSQIVRIKQAVKLPVIGSLNGTTLGGWLSYAALIEQAGADALELNVYELVSDPDQTAEAVEQRTLKMLQAVRGTLRIPIAVKLSPFYTGLPHFARRLREAGADGLVLFNRFYQPDLDTEALEVVPLLRLSDPGELNLRLRWLAILSGRLDSDLACSGGVHGGIDAVKAIMTGAHAVQVVSALLRRGPQYLATLHAELKHWMEEHEYESVAQMRGSMNLLHCPRPGEFERANYIKLLQSLRV